jgi:hypothetical protein
MKGKHMVDGLPLLLLGMGVASAIATALARRKRRPTTVPTSPLSILSDQELTAGLTALRPHGQHHEASRRVTLLIIEEIERRNLNLNRR